MSNGPGTNSEEPGRPSQAVMGQLSVLSRVIPASYFAIVCLGFWKSFVQTGKLTSPIMTLSNIFSNLSRSDMESCYKVFRGQVILEIRIEEDRFGFQPEVISWVARIGCRIYEVGTCYSTHVCGGQDDSLEGRRACYRVYPQIPMSTGTGYR